MGVFLDDLRIFFEKKKRSVTHSPQKNEEETTRTHRVVRLKSLETKRRREGELVEKR